MANVTNPVSAVAIAQLLDAEGFSDFTANMVERYWRRNVMDQRRKGRIQKVDRAFEELIAPNLTDAQRIVLGKFIAVQKKMAFDVGLRIGLVSLLIKHCEEEGPVD